MPDIADIAVLILARRPAGGPLLVGVTGAVAVGKSTFAEALAGLIAAGPGGPVVDIVCTDGFLKDNARLEAEGLTLRKGFPESYDAAAMRTALAAVRAGPTDFPDYSHVTYDIDAALGRRIASPDVLIVEGLGLQEGAGALGLDLLIYLDAEEADLEGWFVGRFMGLWDQAGDDPTSFYARFRSMSREAAQVFARQVWAAINLPNLRQHIVLARSLADIVVRKGSGHEIVELIS
jgi:type I pantothenate kinase